MRKAAATRCPLRRAWPSSLGRRRRRSRGTCTSAQISRATAPASASASCSITPPGRCGRSSR
eukprot:951312-Alexandrium_andersonii.AAC.1